MRDRVVPIKDDLMLIERNSTEVSVDQKFRTSLPRIWETSKKSFLSFDMELSVLV